MSTSPEVAVAIDLGGTWARASVIDRGGQVLWSSRVANGPNASQEELLASGKGLLDRAVAQAASRGIAGVGLAVAGPVDPDTGTLYEPPNLRALDGVSLKSAWGSGLDCPVFVGNDANLAALGEYRYGAGLEARQHGRSSQTLVYVTVSTGIGGGIIERGRMLLGAHGLAGEVGHMVIDMSPNAPPCQCGNSGCLEALASGTAVARSARQRLAAGGWENSALAAGDPERLTSEEVFQAAATGDALARQVVDGAVTALATGLTNVLHLYNPDLLVLGGGVTQGLIQLRLLDRIGDLMRDRAMSRRHRDVRLVASKLGDAVGMIGAAALVWTSLEETN